MSGNIYLHGKDALGLHFTLDYASKIEQESPPYTKTNANVKATKTMNILGNITRISEWIPLFGAVTGVGRVIFASVSLFANRHEIEWTEKKYFKAQLARGVAASTGLGFIFLAVPDVAATVVHHKKYKQAIKTDDMYKNL